jgi:glycerol-3-phosphate dehydrogenase (NAD+)
LITTCYGGRNRKVAEARVKTGKSFHELEIELLGGQKLQGSLTSKEVYTVLKNHRIEKEYPLFVAVYKICIVFL